MKRRAKRAKKRKETLEASLAVREDVRERILGREGRGRR